MRPPRDKRVRSFSVQGKAKSARSTRPGPIISRGPLCTGPAFLAGPGTIRSRPVARRYHRDGALEDRASLVFGQRHAPGFAPPLGDQPGDRALRASAAQSFGRRGGTRAPAPRSAGRPRRLHLAVQAVAGVGHRLAFAFDCAPASAPAVLPACRWTRHRTPPRRTAPGPARCRRARRRRASSGRPASATAGRGPALRAGRRSRDLDPRLRRAYLARQAGRRRMRPPGDRRTSPYYVRCPAPPLGY